jgi:rhodanese-related sulfurtransferase
VTVGVAEAFDRLSIADNGAQIVDVREPDEWAATGVPVGAVLISLGDLEEKAPSELAKDKPVHVICKSGNRSRTGSQILIDLGYPEVYNVDGGIQAWLAAGLPVQF